MIDIHEYPLRVNISDEIHAHPYEPLRPPARVLLYAMLVSAEERAKEANHFLALADTIPGATIRVQGGQTRIECDRFRLKVESHHEVTRYKFVCKENELSVDAPFDEGVHDLLPNEWLKELPGQLITAIDVAILVYPERQSHEQLLERYGDCFDSDYIVASQVGRSENLALTDFRVREDGYTRIAVFSKADLARQNGRLVLRLIEIEMYRILTTLVQPDVRKLMTILPQLEHRLIKLTDTLAKKERPDDEKLQQLLTELATEVENIVALHQRRLEASKVYFNMLSHRLEEIMEKPVEKISSWKSLLERRIGPIAFSAEVIDQRLSRLSGRVNHTSQLLRTSIDVKRERQNQELLIALNERFKVQLRLQETAELLSIVIVPYYAIQLLTYMADELNEKFGTLIDLHELEGIGAPLIIVVTLLIIKGMRHHMRK